MLQGFAALHPLQAGATSTSKAGFPWVGGVGPVEGDAASPPPGPGPAAGGCAFGRLRSSASQAKRPHPCKLGRRIHAAHAPATGPTPPSTGCLLSVGNTLGVRSVFRRKTDLTPEFHSISDRCVDQGRHLPTAAKSVRGGAVWLCRTVGAMDGAIEPPWMGLRRVLTATAPRHPTGSPLLLLLLRLPASGRHYPGCRVQPCRTLISPSR